MSLQANQVITGEMSQTKIKVVKKLGEGGQGEVYLVESPSGPMAVKWYNSEQSTEEQKAAIRYLVQTGPPRNPPSAGKRFIWPQDLVSTPSHPCFGYMMPLIDTRTFAELGEVQGRRKPQPAPRAMCEIGYQAANTYRALHLSGHCYRDISAGNLMFNPQTGDVLICDNDNVGVNRQSKCQIKGTLEFMAPEVILSKADPSTETDLHSLAVLLFYLWMWHHPMHGDLECQLRCWDLPAKIRLYGQNPVFIFDPGNASNRPNDPEYATVRKRWEFCPQLLKQMFIRAFSVGLREPARRVTEGEWQSVFIQLQDGILECPKCRAAVLWDPTATALACWHCRTAVPIPPRLRLRLPTGPIEIPLTRAFALRPHHLDPAQGAEDRTTVLADLAQHPTNPAVWGIRNRMAAPWSAKFPDGAVREIAPQRAAPLNPGLVLNIQGVEAQIIA